uniref:ATP synthase complex subunit 8 n=1 Tax=Halocaridina rubra TaxID=373956 RepID=U5QU40_HALRR|nr:ATP synthase F0 subunit 8 [Halocaridina rubra]
MPQMAPLMWLNLFAFFSASFLLFMIMNYFLKPFPKTSPEPLTPQLFKLNWKW